MRRSGRKSSSGPGQDALGRTLVVLPAASNLPEPVGPVVLRREDVWGVGRRQRLIHLCRFALRVRRAGRGVVRVVLVTGGAELFVVRVVKPFTEIVAADWLMPRSTRLDRVPLLRSVRFVVVRRSDMEVLARRWRIAAERMTFAHFPSSSVPPGDHPAAATYFYAAGWAHRDWLLLLAAQMATSLPLVVAGDIRPADQPRLTSLGPVSVEEGRRLMAGSAAVVLAFKDTELPSGPLVLLDALAMGKAVLVSDVGGSRDYVEHEKTALVVPAGDLQALVDGMRRLWEDGGLRESLGRAARAASSEWSADRFWDAVLS